MLKINSKCTVSREAETLYSELAKDNFRSNYTGLCHGILNTFVGNTFLELPPSSFKNDGAGKGGDTEKKRGDPEKGRNNTSETRSREISRLNFHSSEKIRWFPACNKPEETELLCGIQTFKDGWAFERASRKRHCFCKLDLENAYFLVPLQKDTQKYVKFR